ncbi:HD domain-containing phosphohydrolase [Azohydromonas sediminis]|uniref:HD domain-containing phosphohydrolase n=1 Tax=Azohydromonas sediminis TaxID=2259674 RepID=UPI000E64DE3D|nr:HD domain-containing phosphohydrolase [Azohydromonas sediminis]
MDAAATATQARTPRILLVDDEPANLRLLVAPLEREGYRDLVAIQDPLDVVGRYLEAPVDLILLDLNMPRLDGFAVMAQLRSLREPLLPPILVLTAQRGRDHLLRALAAGARDFVSKPFDRAELVMRVRNLLDAHLAHRLLHERQQVLAEMVQVRTRELHDSRLEILRRLGRAAEFRDEETGNHILRMSHTAALLARAAGWSEADAELMLNAAPMHDVGKIGIPDHILLKPGKLDADEWAVMKTHAEIGARLLEGGGCELLELARTIAWTHHEKWDGSGYPRALAGEAIAEAGRICALADVFDALLSQRPYKPRWSFDDAVAYVKAQSGAHFEPRLVDLFVRHLDEVVAIRARYPDDEPG